VVHNPQSENYEGLLCRRRLGATLAAAVWLYTYRVWDVVEYIDPLGRHFHPTERVRVQPGWSVYATVALILIGAGVSLWLQTVLKMPGEFYRAFKALPQLHPADLEEVAFHVHALGRIVGLRAAPSRAPRSRSEQVGHADLSDFTLRAERRAHRA